MTDWEKKKSLGECSRIDSVEVLHGVVISFGEQFSLLYLSFPSMKHAFNGTRDNVRGRYETRKCFSNTARLRFSRVTKLVAAASTVDLLAVKLHFSRILKYHKQIQSAFVMSVLISRNYRILRKIINERVEEKFHFSSRIVTCGSRGSLEKMSERIKSSISWKLLREKTHDEWVKIEHYLYYFSKARDLNWDLKTGGRFNWFRTFCNNVSSSCWESNNR